MSISATTIEIRTEVFQILKNETVRWAIMEIYPQDSKSAHHRGTYASCLFLHYGQSLSYGNNLGVWQWMEHERWDDRYVHIVLLFSCKEWNPVIPWRNESN